MWMAEERSGYDVLHDAVYDAIVVALGLDESQAGKMVRFTNPIGESQPFEDFSPEENRCYIRLGSATLGGVGMVDRTYRVVPADVENETPEKFMKDISMLDAVTAFFVFYGPDAVTNAERALVFLREDEARERLARDDLAVVPRVPMPNWLPELVNGRWHNRCDIEVQMYRRVKHSVETGAMEDAPEIIIKRSV